MRYKQKQLTEEELMNKVWDNPDLDKIDKKKLFEEAVTRIQGYKTELNSKVLYYVAKNWGTKENDEFVRKSTKDPVYFFEFDNIVANAKKDIENNKDTTIRLATRNELIEQLSDYYRYYKNEDKVTLDDVRVVIDNVVSILDEPKILFYDDTKYIVNDNIDYVLASAMETIDKRLNISPLKEERPSVKELNLEKRQTLRLRKSVPLNERNYESIDMHEIVDEFKKDEPDFYKDMVTQEEIENSMKNKDDDFDLDM